MTDPASMVAPVKSAGSALHPAPADRAKGRRGWRGWLAAGLAVGAPAFLSAARVRTAGRGGGDGELNGDAFYHYSLGGPPELVLWAAVGALLLAGAAVLVWTARNPRGLLAAAMLTAAALAGTALVISRFDGAPVTDRDLRALEPRLSRSAVEDRLGAPTGTGQYTDGRRGLDCLVWTLENPPPGREYALVCFSGDRFRLQRIV